MPMHIPTNSNKDSNLHISVVKDPITPPTHLNRAHLADILRGKVQAHQPGIDNPAAGAPEHGSIVCGGEVEG